MLTYCFKNTKGRLFLMGITLLICAFLTHLKPLRSDQIEILFYLLSILFLGYPITKDILTNLFIHKELNVDFLMILSALGAITIGYFEEASMLLIIFLAAEILENFATSKSTKAIESLMTQVPTMAHLIDHEGRQKERAIEDIQLNDCLLVKKGEQIPIDGICQSDTLINESLLTGESLPVKKTSGSPVFAGTVNDGQTFRMTVTNLAQDTVFSKIISLVNEAQQRPSAVAKKIETLKSNYVLTVLICIPLFIAFLCLFQNYPFEKAFYRGMILLTVASPCALIVSAVPATLSAISSCAKQGILIKDGNLFQGMTQLQLIFSDKTGTLTTGEFQVIDYCISDKLLDKVLYMERQSSHPLAKAITKSFDKKIPHNFSETVHEILGYGLSMGNVKIGNLDFFAQQDHPFTDSLLSYLDDNILYVGENETICGYIVLEDTIRNEASSVIAQLQHHHIDVMMLTGDKDRVAQKVAKKLHINKWQADCKPEDKIKTLTNYQDKGLVIAMIGDGINDAPALAQADISIAMGEGTASAMESSDMVILQNDLTKIVKVYDISQALKRIVFQNIFFSVAVILILILLTITGLLDLTKGVIFHETSTVLVILNSLRLLKSKQ